MKIGIAKEDAGIRVSKPDYPPVDGGIKLIQKGREYYVPDEYDFKHKAAIFSEKKKGGGEK